MGHRAASVQSEPMEARCCACERRRGGLVCPACLRGAVITDKLLQRLEAARQRRDALAAQVQARLAEKEERREQSRRQQALLDATHAASGRAVRAAGSRDAALREAEQLRVEHADRRRVAEAGREQAARAAEEHAQAAAGETRQHLLHLHLAREQARAELRKHVRLLLEIVPLTLSPPRPAAPRAPADQAGPAVSVFGCQLPGSFSIPSGTNQQKLSTALGYATLLLDVLARLLGAPLPVRLRFRGSSSQLWQQRSFWDERPGEGAPVHRLFHASQAAPPPQPGSPAPPPPPPPPQLAGGALAALTQRWPWDAAFKSAPAAAPSLAAATRRQGEELQAAMHQLSRAVGCLRADQALRFGTCVPADWPPFAALAGLCLQLAKEPAADGRRSMAASLAGVPPALAESAAFLDAFVPDGEADDEEFEGWDLVRRPAALSAAARGGRRDPVRMPPTPSDGDEAIGHWERAMITDSSGLPRRAAGGGGGGGLPGGGLGARIAPLGQGALAAADRLWRLGWRG